MSNLELYKEFYFKEIERKNQINNSYSLPILVMTTIVSINVFLLNQETNCLFYLGKILFVLTLISISIAICYLIKSYSNFHKTLIYRELPNMNELLNYEEGLINEQKKRKDAKFLFNEYLRKEFATCATHNFLINKTRTEDIAKSKIAIFVSVISTFVYSITYILNLI